MWTINQRDYCGVRWRFTRDANLTLAGRGQQGERINCLQSVEDHRRFQYMVAKSTRWSYWTGQKSAATSQMRLVR